MFMSLNLYLNLCLCLLLFVRILYINTNLVFLGFDFVTYFALLGGFILKRVLS